MTKSSWWAGVIERLEEGRAAFCIAGELGDNRAEEPDYSQHNR
jgi:hypothetical protein